MDVKNDCIAFYSVRGGNMLAVGEVVRVDREEWLRTEGWFTRDDLLAKMHNKVATVDDLIARTKADHANVMEHLDFLGDPEMHMYRWFKFCRESHSEAIERHKELYWTGMVSRKNAMAMAKHVKSLFGQPQMSLVAPVAPRKK